MNHPADSRTSPVAGSAGSEQTVRPANPAVDAAQLAVADRVVEIADRSQTRDEFLRLLADDLRQHFASAIVAMGASHWDRPMMLVADDLLAAQVDRSSLSDLLATANFNAIACSVPLVTPTLSGQKTVRALRIELTATPERSSALIIYPADAHVDGLTQLSDLKTLRVYAEACRDVSVQVPVRPTASDGDPTNGVPAARSDQWMTSSLVSPDRHSLRLFHRDLDVDKTSFRIANESRRILGCDRVTVLTPKGNKWSVAAVSGVAVVDRRSNAVRSLEDLVRHTIVMARPLVVPSAEPLPPQVEMPIDDYLDLSDVQSAAILPLYPPDPDSPSEGIDASRIDPFHGHGKPIAVMVVENYSGEIPTGDSESQSLIMPTSTALTQSGTRGNRDPGNMINPATTAVAGEAMLALRNSLEHRRVFALPVAQAIGNTIHGRRLPWILLGTFLIAALVAASVMVRTEHYVVASGSLQPEIRRDVFAGLDGIVKEILVKDGQSVTAGTPLLRLENAELESRVETLTGKIATASQQLSSLKSLRLSSASDRDEAGRMAVEQQQLVSELVDLNAQLAIITIQQESLIVEAPIDGIVSAWQIQRRLMDRPVSRGNALMTLVDPDGQWRLHLDVLDVDAGPVLRSFHDRETLPVTFAVATEPEMTFAASLDDLSTAARLNPAGEQVLDGIAVVIPNTPTTHTFAASTSRAGAKVTAKISCGGRSIAGSWFSDVVDFYHRNVAFYFR